MSNPKYKIIFLSGLIIIALFFIFSRIQKNVSSNILLAKPSAVVISQSTNIYFTIQAGASTFNLISQPRQSLYDDLNLAKEKGQITFSGKTYPGLGFFVTDIGSLHSGNGKNLIYYINGKEATVGVSSFIPKSGDVIVWKLQ